VLRSADVAEADAEVVDGEGVIGLFPELLRGDDEEASGEQRGAHIRRSTRNSFTFGYQSMNTAQSVPSLFSGHVSFAAGGAEDTAADTTIQAPVQDMQFGVPVFIF
jgi:hypothetical protein